MSEEFTKYAVDETVGYDAEKVATEGCPNCGSKIERHGQVLCCPRCGTAPFEKEKK